MDDYVENIEQLLNGRKVDYLVINHMEPDHTGAIKALLCHYPDVKIIGNAKTFPMLKNFYGVCENLMEVKEGDSLDLGKHKLNFYMAPMLHWPETMVTFESTEGILFSGDIFGAFGTLDGGIFDDEVDLDYLEEEISRYYSNIVGKYGQPAQTALKKLGGLPIKMVCATHGPIRRSHIADIVAKYDKWSKYDTDKGVVIVFSSMYGNTEKMADIIARFLAEKGIKKIRIHDASKTHPSYIINDIFRYKGVILGSCAYNGNAFPTMETLLFELEHMGVKNHVVAFFGGKAWAGGAMPRFNHNYTDIMGNKNDKKERINVVYSTNPNYQYEYNQEEEQETLAPEKQNLRVTLDSKQRKGKTVTLVQGFVGTEEDRSAPRVSIIVANVWRLV